MASGELRWEASPKVAFVAKPQFYGFIDGGRVTNLHDGFGAGAGIRGQIAGLLHVGIGVAMPLSARRYDTSNSDPVLNFRLSPVLIGPIGSQI